MALITNLQPPAGSPIAADGVITFDVIDPLVDGLRVFVWAVFKDSGIVELVYDGQAFQPLFTTSQIANSPGGKSFSVRRVGGWPETPELRVDTCACPPELPGTSSLTSFSNVGVGAGIGQSISGGNTLNLRRIRSSDGSVVITENVNDVDVVVGPPPVHAFTHENGGSDEINVAGLSGLLADPQTPLTHAATHENGGSDEINVGGLAGLLLDPQVALPHAGNHENGGSDEINVAGLSGVLADPQTPTVHATSHQAGGADSLTVENLATGSIATTDVLSPDGLGGLVMRPEATGGGGASLGIPGLTYESLQLFVDSADRDSYPTSGTSVSDLMGVNPDGVIAGTVTFDDASFRFSGASGEKITIAKAAPIDDVFSGGGTVIVLTRPRGVVGTHTIISTQNASDANGWRLSFADENSDRFGVRFQVDFDTTDGEWRTFDQISRGEPFPLSGFTGVRPVASGSAAIIAVTYNSSSAANVPSFWINNQRWDVSLGLDSVSTPAGSANSDAGNDLILGARANNTSILQGDIAAVLAFDRILSEAEISIVSQVLGSRYGLALGTNGNSASAVLSGQDTVVKGGDNLVSSGAADGGSVFLSGGDTWGTFNNSRGGDLVIRSGSARVSGEVGKLTVTGGRGTSPIAGGVDAEIGGGIMDSGNTGGQTIFRGTDNIATGPAGDTIVRGGDCTTAGSGNDVGGALVLRNGFSRQFGATSPLVLRTVAGSNLTDGETADIYLTTRVASIPGGALGAVGDTLTDSGDIFISTEPGSSANKSGTITLTTGNVSGATANAPGDVVVNCGDMLTSGQAFVGGASFIVTSGNSGGGTSSPGGSITLNAGDQTNAGSSSDGGDVIANPGVAAGSGRDGVFSIARGASRLKEMASLGFVPSAGDGHIWVRNDAPNTLVYTDDDNNEHPLSLMPTLHLTGDNGFAASASGALVALSGADVRIIQFADAVTETFYWQETMPREYSGNGLTVRIFWSHGVGAGAASAVFAVAFERHDTVTPFNVNVSSFSANQTVVAPGPGVSGDLVSADIVFTSADIDGILAGEPMRIRLQRLGADASDTLTISANVSAVQIIENP